MRRRLLALVLLPASLTGCDAHQTARAPRPVAVRVSPRVAPRHPPIRRLLRARRPIYCGGRHKPYAALTFDDGPGPYTRLALRILRHAHVPATFFLVGRNVRPFRPSARREAAHYALGNHSYTHPLLSALAPRAVLSELVRTSTTIRRQTGVAVDLFRPPYEARNSIVDATARRLGLLEILWNVDSGDSEGADHARIARRVRRGISNGAIVLMHENRGQTIRALKFELLPGLRRRHIHLVTVPRLLALDPPSRAQLRRGLSGCRYHERGGRGS